MVITMIEPEKWYSEEEILGDYVEAYLTGIGEVSQPKYILGHPISVGGNLFIGLEPFIASPIDITRTQKGHIIHYPLGPPSEEPTPRDLAFDDTRKQLAEVIMGGFYDKPTFNLEEMREMKKALRGDKKDKKYHTYIYFEHIDLPKRMAQNYPYRARLSIAENEYISQVELVPRKRKSTKPEYFVSFKYWTPVGTEDYGVVCLLNDPSYKIRPPAKFMLTERS